jgi:hypothetical protein
MKKYLALTTLAAALAVASSASAQLVTSITASHDTYVRSDGPNSSYGTDSALLVGGHASVGPFNSFYKFEIPSLATLIGIESGNAVTINSVTLRLTSINSAGAGEVNINLYQLSAANSDWKQGTSGIVPTGTSDTGATFNNKAGQGLSAVTWAGGNTNSNFVAGTDYVNTILGNYTGATNTAAGGQQFNLGNTALTQLIQGSLGGQVDFVILNQTGANSNFLRIASIENGTYAAPQLILDYTVIPEPSTYAAILGLGVLGVALLRRRLRAK